jgi:hypothetical protein
MKVVVNGIMVVLGVSRKSGQRVYNSAPAGNNFNPNDLIQHRATEMTPSRNTS